MSPEALRVCAGCEFSPGSGWLTDAVALFAAFTGVVSFLVAFRAYDWSRKQHDALVLREEFSGHRTAIDAHLRVIDRLLVVLEPSASPAMPISRLKQNFITEAASIRQVLGELSDELNKLDNRELFKTEFYKMISSDLSSVDLSLDNLEDPSITEPQARHDATMVVSKMQLCCIRTRLNIESSIKSALSKGRWHKN